MGGGYGDVVSGEYGDVVSGDVQGVRVGAGVGRVQLKLCGTDGAAVVSSTQCGDWSCNDFRQGAVVSEAPSPCRLRCTDCTVVSDAPFLAVITAR